MNDGVVGRCAAWCPVDLETVLFCVSSLGGPRAAQNIVFV